MGHKHFLGLYGGDTWHYYSEEVAVGLCPPLHLCVVDALSLSVITHTCDGFCTNATKAGKALQGNLTFESFEFGAFNDVVFSSE